MLQNLAYVSSRTYVESKYVHRNILLSLIEKGGAQDLRLLLQSSQIYLTLELLHQRAELKS